jgi:ABC-2 type transport system permease protein
MPLEVTVHRVAAWQQLTAAALMVAAIAAAAYLAARVYRHSVLHVGSSLRWREALTR